MRAPRDQDGGRDQDERGAEGEDLKIGPPPYPLAHEHGERASRQVRRRLLIAAQHVVADARTDRIVHLLSISSGINRWRSLPTAR